MTMSLRIRFAIVALVALFPLVGFYFATRGQLQDLLADRVSAEARAASQSYAELHGSLIAEVETALAVLEGVPDLRESTVEECRTLLGALTRGRPHFTVLGVMLPSGTAHCSSPPFDPDLNIWDRPYFQEVLSTRAPAVSGYQLGRLTGVPVLTLARPVLNNDGEVDFVLAAGLDLTEVSAILRPEENLPPGTTLTFFDVQGQVLLRFPEGEGTAGVSIPPALLAEARTAESSEEARRVADLDGMDRLFGFEPLRMGDGSVLGYAAVGIDLEQSEGAVADALSRNLIWLVLAMAGLVIGVMAILEVTVMGRMSRMVQMATRFGSGDLDARTGLPHRNDEFGKLASTLDQMAENLSRMREEDRRRAVGAIQDREARLRQIAGVIDEVFWIVDRSDGRTRYLSDAYARTWGREAALELAEPEAWLELVHPEDLERARLHATHVRDGVQAEVEFRIIRPDGAVRSIRDRSFPVRDTGGEREGDAPGSVRSMESARISEDVTERRELEEQVSRLQELEAVGRLAGGVAHDFNNILTAIQGYAGFIRDQLDEEDPLRGDVAEITRSAMRAGELTRQLLAFGRRQLLRPALLDLSEVVDEASESIRRALGPEVELEVTLADEPVVFRADRGQIEQILMTLSTNAAEAMADGGRLEIAIRSVRLDPPAPQVEAGALPPGDYVELVVGDNGPGMAPDVLERIFEPFFTTKARGKGSGLGLSSVYGAVGQSGGHIEVESKDGSGATFRIFFPQIASSARV